ncbi:hypothetical protein ACIP6X_02280 [Streptomyces coeruleorubidus]|uniref:hypothetical protein n=1 Tax=Streptomyces coeruleorubidus TaxID=116188 RepID=UPI0038018507
MTDRTELELCPDCGGLRVTELTSIGTVEVTLGEHTGPAELFIGPTPAPCDHAPSKAQPQLNAKVISHWIPGCETGRHNQPHPGQTCDEADEWIRFRDQAIGDMIRANWEQFTRAHQAAALAETAFAAALEGLPPQPPQYTDVQRALDILAPHLAWDPRYRP